VHEAFDDEEAEVWCGGAMQKQVENRSCRMIHAQHSIVQQRRSLRLGGRGDVVEQTRRSKMQVGVGAAIWDVGDEAVQRNHRLRGR
jgi:hypothetical protein